MPRLTALCLSAAALVVGGCTGGDATSSDSVVVASIAPDSTAVIPGSCDPAVEALPPPTITVDGVDTFATFGVGAYECGTITGDGYIVYTFNPVLIDADSAIRVTINSAATATFSWSLGEPFAESGDNVWTSAAPAQGCARLTIQLTSPSGINTATYGADIRVGGSGIDCPQRTIDPTDPGEQGSVPVNTPVGSGAPSPATTTTVATSKATTTTPTGSTTTVTTTTTAAKTPATPTTG